MGNRAVIAFKGHTTGIYLHWNGGPESVYAFLDYADQTVGKSRGWDDDYVIARMFQIIGNFFGGVHSLGVASDIDTSDLNSIDDNYGLDKGVYLVGRAPDNTGRGYQILARYDGHGFSEAEIKQEEQVARKSKYWTGDDSIMKQIAEKNDAFFKETEKARVAW